MSDDRAPSNPPPSARVEILRLDDGEQAVIRFLSGYTDYGILTHQVRGRSLACSGESQCPASHHGLLTIWKGYAPGEVWQSVRRVWRPVVVEITEALEEVLFGRALRGELWHLSRPKVKVKANKLLGLFVEQHEEATLPEPFDPRPVLLHFYHTAAVKWGVANPVPRAIVLPPSQGPAPKLPAELLPAEPVEQTAADRKRVAEEIRRAGGMAKMADAASRQRAADEQNGNGQPKADRGR